MARLDQFGSERPHRGVLLHRIAVRHDDGGGKAVARGREGNALAVIAAGRAYHPTRFGPVALEAIHVDHAAAHLEGAGRRMVLVLHPDLAAGAPCEQRPGILRRRRHCRVHQAGGGLDFVEGQHGASLG